MDLIKKLEEVISSAAPEGAEISHVHKSDLVYYVNWTSKNNGYTEHFKPISIKITLVTLIELQDLSTADLGTKLYDIGRYLELKFKEFKPDFDECTASERPNTEWLV